MGSIERVGFSMPMAACMLGHRRVIKRVSNKCFGTFKTGHILASNRL